MKKATIGEKVSPILTEVENILWEFEAQELGRPKFTDEGFRAATKIFMAAMMDKYWEENKGKSREEHTLHIQRLAGEINKMVFTYTGKDMLKMYDK